MSEVPLKEQPPYKRQAEERGGEHRFFLTQRYRGKQRLRVGWERRAGVETAWVAYRVTSLIRKRNPLGPYRRPLPRVIGGF